MLPIGPEKSGQNQILAEMARKWREFQLQTGKNKILAFLDNDQAATTAKSSDNNV